MPALWGQDTFVDKAGGSEVLDRMGLDYEHDVAAQRGLGYYLGGQGFEVRCPLQETQA